MLMFHAATSDSEIGLPRCGASCATARTYPSETIVSAIEKRALRVDMRDLPGSTDRPRRGTVVVLTRERRRIGHRHLRLTTTRDDLGAGRLHVARLVPRAALEHRGSAVPLPWQAEARERLR